MSEPEHLQLTERTYVKAGARKLSFFSGCDYFRLSRHPRVLAAVAEGIEKYGLTVSASRLTTGNHELYRKLEQELARFFDAPSALVVPNGYLTNLIVAQALVGNFSHVLIDERAHASLKDAARFLDCPVLRFTHITPTSLSTTVQRCGPQARLIVLTDGLFARDGAVSPLKTYLKVLPGDAWLLVDDAHGAGVLGRHGQGTLEHEKVGRSRIIQTVTLSKAFGTSGGAILGPLKLRQAIWAKSQLFGGGTPLPLPLANAALASLKILKKSESQRTRIRQNANFVRSRLKHAGIVMLDSPGPMLGLPVLPKPQTSKMRRALLDAGIYPPFVKYAPGGAAEGYFRFVISSEHSHEQLEALAGVLLKSLGT